MSTEIKLTKDDEADSVDSSKYQVPTEMELELEQTQQGSSHEVLVSTEGVEEWIKSVKKEALYTLRSVLTGSGGSSKDGDGDTSIKVKGTSRTTNNQAFKIKKGMSMSVRKTQDHKMAKRPQVDDQRLDLADDLTEAQVHISSTITSHKTKTTTSMYKILHEESKDYKLNTRSRLLSLS
ncbi:hypothetical protein Tco_1047856 [Tanacetum coccineum]